jgi:hypothetical protein
LTPGGTGGLPAAGTATVPGGGFQKYRGCPEALRGYSQNRGAYTDLLCAIDWNWLKSMKNHTKITLEKTFEYCYNISHISEENIWQT